MMRRLLLFLSSLFAIGIASAQTTLSSCLNAEDFARHWTFESESPDYSYQFVGDTLEIVSPKGMTLWRNEKMQGRTVIEYDACLMDEGREGDRVSDLNCFWMATDPVVKEGSVFKRLKKRSGVFARCYTLALYYVGYGGNSNKTTRFRRYRGEGNRVPDFGKLPAELVPAILTEYTDAAHLNVANRWRHIRIESDGMKIRYYMDGECLVDYRDAQPATEGWFGLRTTWSRLRVTNFRCVTNQPEENPQDGIALRWIERPLADELPVRFGVPFERGKVQPTTCFTLNGDAIDSYPLAYWPDGSVKWEGFAGIVSNDTCQVLRITTDRDARTTKFGKSHCLQQKGAMPGATLRVDAMASQYIIYNNNAVVYLPRTAGSRCFADSITAEGQTIGRNLRLTAGDLTATLDSVVVERQTPSLVVMKCCCHVEGLPQIVRLYIQEGSAAVRLVHTLIYNRTPEQDAPADLALRADVPLHEQAYNRHVAFTLDHGRLWHEPVQPLTGRRNLALAGNGRGSAELYHKQMLGESIPEPEAFDDFNRRLIHDWASWDSYRLSQPLDEGFSIRKSAKSAGATPWIGTLTGQRSTGGCFIGETGRGLALAMQDFWQSYPSTLQIEGATTSTATLTAYLWSPEAETMDLRHYDTEAHGLEASYEDVQDGMSTPEGIGRTTTLMLQATDGYPGDSQLTALLDALTRQPQLVCTPQYLHDQRAFGIWSLPDTLYRETEQQLTYWADFMLGEVERRHWYGFWNYGDVMHAYDTERQEWRYDIGGFAWDNTELASNMMLWYNFLRTGRADLWHAAVAMTRHTSEVDVYHDGPFKGLGSRHNVSHWGCGSKEARISQALWNRFYYYLSGGDERLGELMTAQRDLDTLLYRLDPMRLAQPRGKYPCTAPARLRIGPDWVAYAANWMTEYERTLNPRYWQKIVAGMESISQLPQGMFSGPKALGYDPATGRITWEGDPAESNTNHLLTLMGGFEFMGELLLWDEVPDYWRKTWLQHCAEYRQRAIARKANGYAIGRLPAYAAWQSASGQPSASADGEGTLTSRDEAQIEWQRGAQHPNAFSTNGISTWSLDAIYMLEVCPPTVTNSGD